jgi:hypothetical protein
MAESSFQNLQRMQARYVRNQRERQGQLSSIRHDIKKTAIIILVAAIAVATLADILSVFDVELLVCWAIPMICWFMVRRVVRINKTGERIVATTTVAQRQLQLTRQRLRTALQTTGNAQLLTGSRLENIAWKAGSYVKTFIRDTVITQLVELIPFLNMLPFYIGQVVKVAVDQNIEYQKVRKLLPQLERVFAQLERLERFEIEYAAHMIAAAIQKYTLNQPRTRRAPTPQRQSEAAPVLKPSFAT